MHGTRLEIGLHLGVQAEGGMQHSGVVRLWQVGRGGGEVQTGAPVIVLVHVLLQPAQLFHFQQ